MAKVKKYQAGGKSSKDSVPSEMFPGKMIPREKSNYETGKIGKMAQAAKPAVKAAVKSAVKKKMQKGGSLGMKSVKAGYDSNPGVTRADIIVAAKKEAKYGKKMKKAKHGASLSPSSKSVSSKLGSYKKVIGKAKAGASVKKMMGGGKCKYGC